MIGCLIIFLLFILIVAFSEDPALGFTIVVVIFMVFVCGLIANHKNKPSKEDANDGYQSKNVEEESNDDKNEESEEKVNAEPVLVKLSREQFKDVCSAVYHGKMLCMGLSNYDDICDGFSNQSISSGNYKLYTSKELRTVLDFYLAKDLLLCFSQLGHNICGESSEPLPIAYNTPEGQALYVTLFMLSNKWSLGYDDFRQDMLSINLPSDNRKFDCHLTEGQLKIYSKSEIATIDKGKEDFYLIALVRKYNHEDRIGELLDLYIQYSNAIALCDGETTADAQKWIGQLKARKEKWAKNYDAQRGIVSDTEKKIEERGNVSITKEYKPNAMEELNGLIGLRQVKTELESLRQFIAVNQKRKEAGLRVPTISYHCVFSGNPGTGKTTVARILAGIYKELGILQKGQLVETDRSGLVAEYVGQTAVKTNKIIDKAIGGVLFIDEAYTLAQGGDNDYGREAIATLLKRMEDDRDRLVVILAGYTNEIGQFINSNPGLRSRFNRYIHFDDYTEDELFQIFLLQAKKYDYRLSDDAAATLHGILRQKIAAKQKDFGNARFVRNLFESVIENQAVRLSHDKTVDRDSLAVITKEDIHE